MTMDKEVDEVQPNFGPSDKDMDTPLSQMHLARQSSSGKPSASVATTSAKVPSGGTASDSREQAETPPMKRSMLQKHGEAKRKRKSIFSGTIFARNAHWSRTISPEDATEGGRDADIELPTTEKPHSQHESTGSASGLSRGRPEGEIHKYTELEPGNNSTYRCKRCKMNLGQKNATRFLNHAMGCTLIETPAKIRLSRSSKSKSIGKPRSRSEVGLALERANNASNRSMIDECDTATGARDPDDLATPVTTTDGNSNQRKRSSSNSNRSGSRASKRKKDDFHSHIIACSPSYVKGVIESAMEYLVSSAAPFSIFDRREGRDSPFIRLIRSIHPDLVKHLPGSQFLSGKYLDKYYANMKREVRENVLSCLKDGYATVIFDGWDDINSASVVNVLLKMEPAYKMGGQAFFLKTVYTGSRRVSAAEYVGIIENVMAEYGGMDRICAITSDNASSCLSARNEITSKYAGIVGVNDQSHVADLLIQDICQLPWISSILKVVAGISTALHNHRKLKERYRILMEGYNRKLKSHADFVSQAYQSEERRMATKERLKITSDRDPRIVFEGFDDVSIRSAVMLLQMSNTRFASAEGVLDAFLRSIEVLQTLVTEPDFFTELYKPKNYEMKTKITEQFKQPLEDEQFEVAAREIHMILVLLRRYLRFFDSDQARISEVYPLTRALEERLEGLPLSQFLTKERKAELMLVFSRRKDGPIGKAIKVRLLENIHYVAFMLDPNQAPRRPGPLMPYFFAHLQRYAASSGITNKDYWVSEMMLKYSIQVENWYSSRHGIEGKKILAMYRGNPLIWWNFAGIADPDLAEFAARTLSSSPTSCAVERSFSAQKRIHPKERNRLSREKVQKLLFCQWNLRLKRKLDAFDKDGFSQSIKDVNNMLGDTVIARTAAFDSSIQENDTVDIDDDMLLEPPDTNIEDDDYNERVEIEDEECRIDLEKSFENEETVNDK